MYIRVDELDNIGFNKIHVKNKETIIDDYDKKNWSWRSKVEEQTTKMTLLNINFQNDVIQKCLQKNGYQNPLKKMLTKNSSYNQKRCNYL
jgi:hypothetical protein